MNQVGEVHLAGFQPGGEVGVGLEEARAQNLERDLDLVGQAVARGFALAGASLAPALQRAVGGRGVCGAEAGPVDQEPERGEGRDVLGREDLGEVGLDVGRARQGRVVPHEAKVGAVGDDAPQRLVGVVEVVLKCEGGRAGAIDGQGRAAAVQRLARRHHDDGNAAAGDHGERRGGRRQVVEAEGLLEEAGNETAGRVLGGRLELREGIEVRLADAESGRDFLADRETLADGVVLRRLFRSVPLVDPGDHRGRDQVALEAERGPRGHVGDRFARHDHTSPGMRTNKPITSGGRTASTLTREMDPAAARRRA